MQIVWDEPKRLANLDKHGMDFVDLTVAFLLDAVIVPARMGRFKAIHRLGGRAVTAVILPLGSEAVSVTSLRWASANERKGLS